MGKLTKKAVIAAHDEVSELIGGFKPAIELDVLQAELEVNVYQAVLDIDLDDDDRSNLGEETLSVIDSLSRKYPDMVPTPDDDDTEVEEAEEVKEEKKSKKSKKDKKVKKSKKEEAPVEEVKEEKKAKKAKKSKKGGNEALIEQINTVKYGELKNIVKENDVFEGFPAVGLSNEMFRSELIAVLNGEKTCEEVKAEAKAAREAGKKAAAKDKPKKEKKAKKEKEPTLAEQVEMVDDLDELKAFCKANKDNFPGVKAKKFDKVKKLRKAMLKVVVEPAKEKKTVDKPKQGKTGKVQVDMIRELIAAGTDRAEMVTAMAEEFGQTEAWANNRIKLHENKYGPNGENDPKQEHPKGKGKSKKEAKAEKPAKEEKKGKKGKK